MLSYCTVRYRLLLVVVIVNIVIIILYLSTYIYIYIYIRFLSRTYFVERSTQLIEEHQLYYFTEVQVSQVIYIYIYIFVYSSCNQAILQLGNVLLLYCKTWRKKLKQNHNQVLL